MKDIICLFLLGLIFIPNISKADTQLLNTDINLNIASTLTSNQNEVQTAYPEASDSPFVKKTHVPLYSNIIVPERDLEVKPVGDGVADDTAALEFAIAYAIKNTPSSLVLNNKYRISKVLQINGARQLDIGGSGSITKIGATQSGIFRLINGCYQVRIANLTLIGGYSANIPSTGTPNGMGILIGAIPNDGMATNRGITIENNIMKGFNHSAILVHGNLSHSGLEDNKLYKKGMPLTLANEFIRIENNRIFDSSNGIFIYKNTNGVVIQKNHVSDTGYAGIVVDTAAETDRNYSMPITKVRIYDNLVERAGTQHASRGLTLKGAIYDMVVARNKIRDVYAKYSDKFVSTTAYGILVVYDFYREPGRDIIISQNNISGIFSDKTLVWGLYVGQGHNNTIVQGNSIDNIVGGSLTRYCMHFGFTTNTKVYGNEMSNCGNQALNKLIYNEEIASSPVIFTDNKYFGQRLLGLNWIFYK